MQQSLSSAVAACQMAEQRARMADAEADVEREQAQRLYRILRSHCIVMCSHYITHSHFIMRSHFIMPSHFIMRSHFIVEQGCGVVL